jgi:hypothetical protein
MSLNLSMMTKPIRVRHLSFVLSTDLKKCFKRDACLRRERRMGHMILRNEVCEKGFLAVQL